MHKEVYRCIDYNNKIENKLTNNREMVKGKIWPIHSMECVNIDYNSSKIVLNSLGKCLDYK